MNKKNIFILIILLSVIPNMGFGAEQYNLKTTIDQALTQSYRINNLRRDLSVSLAKDDYIKNFYLPEKIEVSPAINFSSGAGRSMSSNLLAEWAVPWVDVSNKFAYSDNANMSNQLEVSIYQNDIYFSFLAAKLNLLSAQKTYFSRKQKFINDIVTAYFNFIISKRRILINKTAAARAEKYLEKEKLYVKAGVKTKYDVLKAEVQVANLKSALSAAENELELSEQALKYLAGLPINADVSFDTSFDISMNFNMSLAECVKKGFENRLDIPISKLNRKIVKKRLAYFKSTRWIVPTFKFDYRNTPATGQDFSAYLGLDIPLYDRKFVMQQMLEQTMAYNKAVEDDEQIRQRVEIEIKTAYFNMKQAENNLNTLKKQVAAAEEKMRVEELRYKVGSNKKTMQFLEDLKSKLGQVIDIDLSANLFDAQNNLILLKNQYYQAVMAYYNSVINLYTAMGVDFDSKSLLNKQLKPKEISSH